MNQYFSLRLEILFLILAAALTAFVLFPIRHAGIDFPYYAQNAIFVLLSVILFKHIFLLKYSWINRFQKLKIAFIPLSVVLIIMLIRMLGDFINFMDEQPLSDLMPDMPYERQKFLTAYIRVEYITSAILAITAAIILPFRFLVSIWREVNRR